MTSPSGKKKADLKVVILGAASVGKTTLIHRYIERNFKDQISTIGASFSLKQWGPYNVALWDTAGEERFSGLSSFYCRGAGAAILAFDITSEESFTTLRTRFIPLLNSANDQALVVVVGTKLDLLTTEDHMRQVTTTQGHDLVREVNAGRNFKNNIPYFETSSLTGDNVDKVFEYILRECLPLDAMAEKKPVKRSTSVVDLNEPKKGSPESGGCKC